MEKLLKLAVTGKQTDAGVDPMRFKPALADMVGDAEDAGDEDAPALYEAPKVSTEYTAG